jgi:hypothetical protein
MYFVDNKAILIYILISSIKLLYCINKYKINIIVMIYLKSFLYK